MKGKTRMYLKLISILRLMWWLEDLRENQISERFNFWRQSGTHGPMRSAYNDLLTSVEIKYCRLKYIFLFIFYHFLATRTRKGSALSPKTPDGFFHYGNPQRSIKIFSHSKFLCVPKFTSFSGNNRSLKQTAEVFII